MKNKRITKKEKKKKRKKRSFLHLAAKIHAGFTIVMLLAYVSFGVFLGPEYLTKDISNKYKALAASTETTLTLEMIGPPDKPIVSVSFFCNSIHPYVDIAWNSTRFTGYYDIYRNGELLISGLSDIQYHDTNIQENTAYIYYVVANGSAGTNQSDEALITTGSSCYIPPQIECKITRMLDLDLTNFSGIPETANRTPTFYGTTSNVDNARIEISVHSEPEITGATTANTNGYWSWTVPQELDYGEHTIYATVRDPLDNSRFAQTSQKFIIKEATVEEDSGDDDENHKKKENKKKKTTKETLILTAKPPQETPAQEEDLATPFKMELGILNENKSIIPGENINFLIKIIPLKENLDLAEVPISYQIIDSTGKVISEIKDSFSYKESRLIQKIIPTRKNLKSGRYTVRAVVNIEKDNYYISADDWFNVKTKATPNIGLSVETSEVMLSYLGWTSLFLVLILLFFLFFLFIEHKLFLQAKAPITEDELNRDGFIS